MKLYDLKLRQTLPLLCLLGSLCPWSVNAETVKVPVAQQGSAEVRAMLPQTGQSKEAVMQKLGQPVSTRGPFGEPPITTWTYSEFTVYFEHDHVIHAVINVKKR